MSAGASAGGNTRGAQSGAMAPRVTSNAAQAGTPASSTPATSGTGGSMSAGSQSAGNGAGSSGTGMQAAGAGAAGVVASSSGASFPAVSDLGGDGPYSPMTVMSTGPNGAYTIYRPMELAPGGAKNPVVAWMSGGGSTPSQYELLPHLASHGFVVVASNTSPGVGQEVELGKELLAGIDWMLKENADSASPFFEKLDASKVASMGYSMGALATTTIGADPRLTTTIHISGGNMTTDRVKMLHAPAAFVCGASGVDIAGANCATDFDAATSPVFYAVFNGGDHLGVRTQPYAGRIQVLVTGWLRWQLMSDMSLASMFVGDQCTLCKDPNWTVKQKDLQ